LNVDTQRRREHFERLNATLLPQLPALVKQWLPAGRASGMEWTALNPRRHDRRPGSFRVNLRSGQWADFATGEGGGDPVSLYAYLFTGGRQGAAARALDGGRIAVRQAGAAKVAKAANPDADELRRIARARAIHTAASQISGAAEAYLLSRGLHPVPAWERLRATVLRYPEAGKHPAIIAPVTAASGAVEGIQRTFLTADGCKLPVRDPKLSLGRVRGGAIRLAEPANEVVLCEGLEDGLSLAQELPDAHVWAAPGAGMLSAISLPSIVSRVIIAADNDAPGEQAAMRVAERFASEGRLVRIMRPELAYKDWNDQLRRIAR
jgi:DNA primase